MKKLLLLSFICFTITLTVKAQCTGNLVTNGAFGSGLPPWAQYGAFGGVILTGGNPCLLNNYLALQATNNSNSGDSQSVAFTRDTCYQLCYCYEFPNSGSLFNNKLTVAAITTGVTPGQLLSGSFSPAQAMIIDTISSTTAIAPVTQCPTVFKALSNYTALVFINETIGAIGTDVRIDNVCLTTHPCAGTVQLAENSIDNALVILPNPASNQLFFKSKTKVDRLILFNIRGQKVVDLRVENNAVDLPSDLSNGLYTSLVYTGNEMVYRKIAVNR